MEKGPVGRCAGQSEFEERSRKLVEGGHDVSTFNRGALAGGAAELSPVAQASMTNYEKTYRETANACGDPFPEIVAFFRERNHEPLDVLDLGCGQGRDALMAARFGHRVTGVDLARSGVEQMSQQALVEGLQVSGLVADIIKFQTSESFDVVILDRVLHMLRTNEDRIEVLTKACGLTRRGGYLLVADVPSNLNLISEFFAAQSGWSTVYQQRNFRFALNACASAA